MCHRGTYKCRSEGTCRVLEREKQAALFSTAAWGARKLPGAGLPVPEDQTAAHSQPHAQARQGGIQFCFQGLMSGKPYLNVPSHEAREDARP